MSRPGWWLDLETEASRQHDKFSGAWWAAMRDGYLRDYPDADARSVSNMREFAAQAAGIACSCADCERAAA